MIAEPLRRLPAARIGRLLVLDVRHVDRLAFGDSAAGERFRSVRQGFTAQQLRRTLERCTAQNVPLQDVDRRRFRVT